LDASWEEGDREASASAAVRRVPTGLPLLDMSTEKGAAAPLASAVRPHGSAASLGAVASVVPDLVAAQSTAAPDLLAVAHEGETLRYRDLDLRANQLANHLRSLGVAAGVRVGLLAERSSDLVVGALGIMRAGGAYVPMDPSYPAERLEFMVRDSGAPVLVAQQAHSARISLGKVELVAMDWDCDGLAQASAEPVRCSATGADLAYVIYTSGSTGEPKGVELTHDNLLHLVSWHRREFGVTADDRATQLAGPGFDASVWELWPYLTAGASISIPSELVRLTPQKLRDWLVSEQITLTFVPTVLAEQLLTLEWPAETSLRYMLTGGDALHRFPPQSLPFTLVNNYGPTETTVVATSGAVPPSSGGVGAPSIGMPIEGVTVYIVDSSLRLVPRGDTGELLIGGAGIARGYLDRPELTNQRFIPDHFSDRSGARLYRTGDLVRTRPDGELAFVGRVDDQLKIRGNRIEPGEIATTLNRHPSVHASVVVAAEQLRGEKRLVAFVVPADKSQADPDALRSHLGHLLPDYMVPAEFVWLPDLPLTPNGKIDLARLAASGALESGPPEIGAKPHDELEEVLATIIAGLLGLDAVGTDENFFTLGGHSLLAAQVIARIRDRFDVELPLRDLFDRPTVAEMALSIRQLVIADLDAMSDEDAERLARSGPQ